MGFLSRLFFFLDDDADETLFETKRHANATALRTASALPKIPIARGRNARPG
jgi:hypothetical protein